MGKTGFGDKYEGRNERYIILGRPKKNSLTDRK